MIDQKRNKKDKKRIALRLLPVCLLAIYLGELLFWNLKQTEKPLAETVTIEDDQVPLAADLGEALPGAADSVGVVLSEGQCGEQIQYVLYDNGTLSLYGIGATEKYTGLSRVPWLKYADVVTKVEVSDGITELRKGLFRACENLAEVSLGKDIKEIERKAFPEQGIQKTSFNGTKTEWERISIGSGNGSLAYYVIYR